MSRAGRKRIAAQRKSGIRIITAEPDRARSPNEVARSQPHRHGFTEYESICHDARAASSFGQLNLIGAIPDDLYQAGQRFAGIVRRWREAVDAPNLPPSSIGRWVASEKDWDAEPLRRPTDDEPKTPEQESADRRAAYDNAMGRLATASKQARATTLWVVVEGGRVPGKGFRPLMEGLRALQHQPAQSVGRP